MTRRIFATGLTALPIGANATQAAAQSTVQEGRSPSTRSVPRPRIIDFHAHMLEPEVLRQSTGRTVLSGFGQNAHGGTQAVNETTFGKMLDPQRQLEDMDKRGIDTNVVSSATVIQGTSWADPQTDLDLCKRCNDCMADWVARYPNRFIGSFTLPLQDVTLALGELERCAKQLGLRVANLCTQYHGAYIGEPRYRPFWETANELGVIVWIHPDGVRDLWFQKFGMWNSIGQSIEEAKVMASLIYEGVMETFPNLKIVISHGGGYFPHNTGRLDRNVTNRPDSMKNITRKPSEYLRSFYYDTCLFDQSLLAALIARVGADRLVMGSDYPVGDADPKGFVEKCPTLSPDQAAMIMGGTAANLLRCSMRFKIPTAAQGQRRKNSC